MRMLEVHAWRIAQRALCYGKRRAAVLRWNMEEYQKKESRNICDK